MLLSDLRTLIVRSFDFIWPLVSPFTLLTLKSSKYLYADSDLQVHATAVSISIEQKYTGKLNRVLRIWRKKKRSKVWYV